MTTKYTFTLAEGCLLMLVGVAIFAAILWVEALLLHWGWNTIAPAHAITTTQAYAVVLVLMIVGGFFKSSGGTK